MRGLLSIFAILLVSNVSNAMENEMSAGSVDPKELYYNFPQEEPFLNKFNLNYFGIFYGPSVKTPNAYQPNSMGGSDLDRPLLIKNFLSLGYSLSDQVTVTGTAFWAWQPVLKQQLALQDPFARIAKNSIFRIGNLNLYGDLRAHFPVTYVSRENDLLFGLQTFQALTYEVPDTRLILGLYGSLRSNFFGRQGYGNDMELYLAPNFNYQLSAKAALTMLWEMQASHTFGHHWNNDGMDVEPGVSWEIVPQFMINPYLNMIPTHLSLGSTSIGMLVSWMLL